MASRSMATSTAGAWEGGLRVKATIFHCHLRLKPILIGREATGGPEVKWVSKATLEEHEEDIARAEKVMVCEVNGDQWDRVGKYSSVKQTLLWINGKKRIGWVVREPGCSAED